MKSFQRTVLPVLGLLVVVSCVSDKNRQSADQPAQPGETISAKPVAKADKDSIEAGRLMFWTGGCASCHAAANAKGEARLMLGGGMVLKSKFGPFRVPNISPDKKYGIGAWSDTDFVRALTKGIRPDGKHYFPAFPYTSYARMKPKDVGDLWAFLQTLPPVANKVVAKNATFPFKTRASVGVWKSLYFKKGKKVRLANMTREMARGQYLVEGPAHCGECHTPRNKLGGFEKNRWLGGGEAEKGDPPAPNITPHEDGIGDWTIDEIMAALLPSGTGRSSSMDDVRHNMAMLPKGDRRAIAAYLKAIPAVATPD